MSQKSIILLKGGDSSEREVSLKTGAAVGDALRQNGYDVEEIDVREGGFLLPEDEREIFICLHGTFGEDGELQKLLESKQRVFTGSGSKACAAAFDKVEACKLMSSAGVRVPKGGRWSVDSQCELPFVLKPVAEGSSVGVFLVKEESERGKAEEAAESHGAYMFEELIVGRELTIGILGGRVLPVVEIKPYEGFYDYENKYSAGKADHVCPAKIDEFTTVRIQETALKAFQALGCEVYGRVDVILPEVGDPVVLEVNTIPGMTELSLLPEAAAAAGINFGNLCEEILKLSQEVRS